MSRSQLRILAAPGFQKSAVLVQFPAVQEFDHRPHMRVQAIVHLKFRENHGKRLCPPAGKEHSRRRANGVDVFFAESSALEAQRVDAAHLVTPIDLAEGGDIVVDARVARRCRRTRPRSTKWWMPTPPMMATLSSHDDMAGDHHVIGDDHTVADLGVVPDMAVDHVKPVVADAGDAAAFFGADVDGDGFAEDIARCR